MKCISTSILMCFLAYSTFASGGLGGHIIGSNSMQSADRVRALLKSDMQEKEGDSFLDMVETQVLEGAGSKRSDNIYNASGGVARIDKYLGDSSLLGVSLSGIYTEVDGDTMQSQDLSIATNIYGATQASSLPLGAFVDLSYANFLGDGTSFGNKAVSALGGLSLNIKTSTEGLSYSPVFMLNSLYLEDSSKLESANYNALRMMLGIELDYAINKNYTASLKGLYAYEFKDTTGAYNYNSFTGSYTSLGDAGKESLQLGATLNYNFNDTISAGFDYSIYIYDTFISNNISLKLDFSF